MSFYGSHGMLKGGDGNREGMQGGWGKIPGWGPPTGGVWGQDLGKWYQGGLDTKFSMDKGAAGIGSIFAKILQGKGNFLLKLHPELFDMALQALRFNERDFNRIAGGLTDEYRRAGESARFSGASQGMGSGYQRGVENAMEMRAAMDRGRLRTEMDSPEYKMKQLAAILQSLGMSDSGAGTFGELHAILKSGQQGGGGDEFAKMLGTILGSIKFA